MSILNMISKLFSPKLTAARSETDQAIVDKQTAHLKLYDMGSCPFCIKVRREITRLNLDIEIVNSQLPENKQYLQEQGGKTQVPCLLIQSDHGVTWLYESSAIISYLNQRFC